MLSGWIMFNPSVSQMSIQLEVPSDIKLNLHTLGVEEALSPASGKLQGLACGCQGRPVVAEAASEIAKARHEVAESGPVVTDA